MLFGGKGNKKMKTKEKNMFFMEIISTHNLPEKTGLIDKRQYLAFLNILSLSSISADNSPAVAYIDRFNTI